MASLITKPWTLSALKSNCQIFLSTYVLALNSDNLNSLSHWLLWYNIPYKHLHFSFLSDEDETYMYTNFLKTRTCYDIMPKSSKIVVFDTKLRVS